MSDAPDQTDSAIRYELDGNVAVVHFDDGKANVLTHAAIAALQDALSSAERDEARAVVIIGRPGKFSAGFDLSVMTAGPDQARDLLRAGAELARRDLHCSRSPWCSARPATRWPWAPSC